MALSFPNASRSFNEARRGVRFLGHDGMFEVPFLVEASALKGAGSESEASCLAAFDAARNAIHEAARKTYSRSRQPAYILTSADFQ